MTKEHKRKYLNADLRRTSGKMIRQLLGVTAFLFGFVHFAHCQNELRYVVGEVDICAIALSAHTTIPVSLSDLATEGRHVGVISSEEFLKDLNEQLASYRTSKKRLNRGVPNLRVLIAFKYSDGGSGYIAGNDHPFFLYDNQTYKDQDFGLYQLLIRHLEVRDLRSFLAKRNKL